MVDSIIEDTATDEIKWKLKGEIKIIPSGDSKDIISAFLAKGAKKDTKMIPSGDSKDIISASLAKRTNNSIRKNMSLQEFETKLGKLRADNGWTIKLEFLSIWIITIFDKETGKRLAQTGTTALAGILTILNMPFDKPPWTE